MNGAQTMRGKVNVTPFNGKWGSKIGKVKRKVGYKEEGTDLKECGMSSKDFRHFLKGYFQKVDFLN